MSHQGYQRSQHQELYWRNWLKTEEQLKSGGTTKVWDKEWTIAKSASGEILGAWPADQSDIAEAFLRNNPEASTYKTKYVDVVGETVKLRQNLLSKIALLQASY